jgi:hypothetical protein
MGRAWRIEFENALYHFMSRGNAGNDIFVEDKDRKIFLKALNEISERFEIDRQGLILGTKKICQINPPDISVAHSA